MPPRALIVTGPTATGKTGLVLTSAGRLPIEVVNGDALQAVRGLDIGTGKPTLAERENVPHHLFDVVSPEVRFSAGEYARLARPIVQDILGRGSLPVVVGGSGFYLEALMEGLAELPAPDPALRDELRRWWQTAGPGPILAELGRVDPRTAARLPPADRQRILRALEVHRQTGLSLSDWHDRHPPVPASFDAVWLAIDRPREQLAERIRTRVQAMVDAGWLEEIGELLGAGLSADAPGLQAIGYREMLAVVQGLTTLEEAIESTVRATTKYAKRQRTWLRRRADLEWRDAGDPATLDRLVELGQFALGKLPTRSERAILDL